MSYGAIPLKAKATANRLGTDALLSAIGQRLKDPYTLATPVPPQLATLVKRLEAQILGISKWALQGRSH